MFEKRKIILDNYVAVWYHIFASKKYPPAVGFEQSLSSGADDIYLQRRALPFIIEAKGGSGGLLFVDSA